MNLRLENISKSFGGQRVLEGIDARFEGVRSLVLIGPSGGGKSTLLRIVAGLERADSGHVELNGERVPEEERALRRYRRGVGVVFQGFNLFPHLSALENLTLPLEKAHSQTPEAARENALAVLRRFRLEAHAAKRPGQLSGGQKQRVAVARSLMNSPELVLADEPTGNLDRESADRVMQLLTDINAGDGTGFLISTHDEKIAARCRRQIHMADGKIATDQR